MEVWRGTDDSEEREGREQSSPQQNASDSDPQERRLDCVVRTRSVSFVQNKIQREMSSRLINALAERHITVSVSALSSLCREM